MRDYKTLISQYVGSQREQILQDIRTLVNMESHFEEKENVEAVRSWVWRAFEAEGFHCFIEEVAPDRAGLLVGTLGEDRPGQPVLFSGHMDTVFHKGFFGTDTPFSQDGDTLRGPGVHDMKSGIIMALYAVKALNHTGWAERPIKILFVGEEESDHHGNHADEQIARLSQGCFCAFNMESGKVDNTLCIGRKSQFTYTLKISGKGGHAGCDYMTGKNAIIEAANKIQKIIQIADWDNGTTVTPTLIQGGTHNSSIPEECELTVDVRVLNDEEAERVYKEMTQIASTSEIEGTHTQMICQRCHYYPYGETAEIATLHQFLCEAAADLGYPAFGKMVSGGAADSGNIAHAGVPVLCACGICGGNDHSRDEYALLSSAYDRIKIFAYAITKAAVRAASGCVTHIFPALSKPAVSPLCCPAVGMILSLMRSVRKLTDCS